MNSFLGVQIGVGVGFFTISISILIAALIAGVRYNATLDNTPPIGLIALGANRIMFNTSLIVNGTLNPLVPCNGACLRVLNVSGTALLGQSIDIPDLDTICADAVNECVIDSVTFGPYRSSSISVVAYEVEPTPVMTGCAVFTETPVLPDALTFSPFGNIVLTNDTSRGLRADVCFILYGDLQSMPVYSDIWWNSQSDCARGPVVADAAGFACSTGAGIYPGCLSLADLDASMFTNCTSCNVEPWSLIAIDTTITIPSGHVRPDTQGIPYVYPFTIALPTMEGSADAVDVIFTWVSTSAVDTVATVSFTGIDNDAVCPPIMATRVYEWDTGHITMRFSTDAIVGASNLLFTSTNLYTGDTWELLSITRLPCCGACMYPPLIMADDCNEPPSDCPVPLDVMPVNVCIDDHNNSASNTTYPMALDVAAATATVLNSVNQIMFFFMLTIRTLGRVEIVGLDGMILPTPILLNASAVNFTMQVEPDYYPNSLFSTAHDRLFRFELRVTVPNDICITHVQATVLPGCSILPALDRFCPRMLQPVQPPPMNTYNNIAATSFLLLPPGNYTDLETDYHITGQPLQIIRDLRGFAFYPQNEAVEFIQWSVLVSRSLESVRYNDSSANRYLLQTNGDSVMVGYGAPPGTFQQGYTNYTYTIVTGLDALTVWDVFIDYPVAESLIVQQLNVTSCIAGCCTAALSPTPAPCAGYVPATVTAQASVFSANNGPVFPGKPDPGSTQTLISSIAFAGTTEAIIGIEFQISYTGLGVLDLMPGAAVDTQWTASTTGPGYRFQTNSTTTVYAYVRLTASFTGTVSTAFTVRYVDGPRSTLTYSARKVTATCPPLGTYYTATVPRSYWQNTGLLTLPYALSAPNTRLTGHVFTADTSGKLAYFINVWVWNANPEPTQPLGPVTSGKWQIPVALLSVAFMPSTTIGIEVTALFDYRGVPFPATALFMFFDNQLVWRNTSNGVPSCGNVASLTSICRKFVEQPVFPVTLLFDTALTSFLSQQTSPINSTITLYVGSGLPSNRTGTQYRATFRYLNSMDVQIGNLSPRSMAVPCSTTCTPF